MINSVILVGRTTKNIEIRQTQTGIKVCNFTLAVNDNFDKEKTHFINCVAWKTTAELMSSYVNKGDLIGVEGALQQRTYEDKNGQKQSVYEVLCSRVQFMQPKAKTENTQQAQSNEWDYKEQEESVNYDEEDLPF